MSEQKGTRVYVGNLTDKVKKEDLEGEFTKYGKLNSVWVAFNPPGFAFIEFENKEEAESACDNLNGQDILGSKLRVEISKGRRSTRGGGARGGFRSGGFRDGGGRSSGGDFRSSSRGGFRDGGFRSSSRGGFRDAGSYRNGSGGGRPSGTGGYNRDSGRDSYGSGGGGYGGRSGGGGGGRFRSRSPVGARGRY